MSTTTQGTHRAQPTAVGARTRAQRRSLPRRALLAQLGTADAVRERLTTAAKPLTRAEARKRASSAARTGR